MGAPVRGADEHAGRSEGDRLRQRRHQRNHPLGRAIQRDIEDVLSEKLLFGDFAKGQTIVVDVDEENIPVTFTFTGQDPDAPLPDDVVAIAEPENMDGLTAGVDHRRQDAGTQPSGLSAAN